MSAFSRPPPMRLLRRYDWRTAGWAVVGTTVPVLLLVFLTREVLGWDFEEATRAPLAAVQPWSPAYGGWFGSFAVLGWTATAAVCALGAGVADGHRRRVDRRLLIASAALSTVLLADDLFLFHHTIAPQRLGVPKPAVLLALVALAGVWAFAFRDRLLVEQDLPVLVWAALAYSMSLWIDSFGHLVGWGGVREEVAKLVGVGAWLLFHWRVSLRAGTAGAAA